MAIFHKKADPLDPSQPEGKIPDYDDKNTHSQLPGDRLANPYLRINPAALRRMYDNCPEFLKEKRKLMWKALKQWAGQYSDSLINPYKYEKYFADIAKDFDLRDLLATEICLRIAALDGHNVENSFVFENNSQPTQGGDLGESLHTQDGGGDSIKDPLINDKNLVFPKDFEQNIPETPSWSEGNYLSPYESTRRRDFETLDGGPVKMSSFFKDFVWASDDGVDAYLNRKASRKKESKIIKVADLDDYIKVGDHTLIHKSDRDLWAMEQDEDGNMVISRLFDGDVLK